MSVPLRKSLPAPALKLKAQLTPKFHIYFGSEFLYLILRDGMTFGREIWREFSGELLNFS